MREGLLRQCEEMFKCGRWRRLLTEPEQLCIERASASQMEVWQRAILSASCPDDLFEQDVLAAREGRC